MSIQSKNQPLEIGNVRAVRFNVEIRAGNHTWSARNTLALSDNPEWRAFADDARDCLWVGHTNDRGIAWSRVPWGSVDYLAYYQPGEKPELTMPSDRDTITDIRKSQPLEPR